MNIVSHRFFNIQLLKHCMFSALLFISSSAISAEIFRWVDSNGVVHYGERGNAPTESKKVVIKDSPILIVPSEKETTVATTDSDASQTVSTADNLAKCATFARAMVNKPGKSEWIAYSKKIQLICPGKGFECKTYNHHPEKNTCTPFEWNGSASFFKDTKLDFPMNSHGQLLGADSH